MKKIAFGLLIAMSVMLVSCFDDDDGYSVGNYWIGFGILQEEDGVSVFAMDDHIKLKPLGWSHNSGWNDEYTPGSRVLVNYTVLGDDADENGDISTYFVRVNEIRKILKKGILELTPENADSIGNDPIIVEDVWVTDSLLNFQLKYWGYQKIHFLNLVENPDNTSSEEGTVKLELRHNANDDDLTYPYSAFVSFNLNELRMEGRDSIRVEVISTDYDDVDHTYKKVFNYANLELPE
ncbi:NigD-like C-terminal domain-containing protein [Maribellus sp. YY47]|uniref:NigD1/NigD2 family lipoprotein n=1 Tax=Maribellus sp. YY47 TaxID=2929486 RepID=UPI002001D593|nr:NigD-like C-terminal domain-containing protein [Maribellus sp. YY47]MCK3685054.1 hypothetical protein [Maribellus sp. YY47]